MSKFKIRLICGVAASVMMSSPILAETVDDLYQSDDPNYPVPSGQESYLATAAPMPTIRNSYFGLSGGISRTTLRPSLNMVRAGNTYASEAKRTPLGYHVGIYGGCGRNFYNFYLGSELSVAYNFLDRRMEEVVGGSRVQWISKQPITVGMDLMPGYLGRSGNWMFYGRLGLGVGWFKLNFQDLNAKVQNNFDKLQLGLRSGVGIEYYISDNVSLRTEYLFSKYRRVEKTYQANDISYRYGLGNTGSHQFNVGLTIHF